MDVFLAITCDLMLCGNHQLTLGMPFGRMPRPKASRIAISGLGSDSIQHCFDDPTERPHDRHGSAKLLYKKMVSFAHSVVVVCSSSSR